MTKTFKFSIDNIFTNGTYTVSCAVASFDRSEVYSRIEEACQLVLSGWTMPHSMTHPENSVMISDS